MNNELWRGYGREYTRGLVRKRDKYQCQKCIRIQEQGERAFDVHHLKGLCGKKSRGYDRITDMPTLVTLCHRCHMNLHATLKKFKGKPKKSLYKTTQGKRIIKTIISLRTGGYGFDMIARMMNKTYSSVYKLYQRNTIPTISPTSV